MSKIPLYIDGDDVILQSSDAIINILNKIYAPSIPKTFADIKDWNYKCIFPKTTQKEITSIFESDEFWSSVKIDPIFLDMCSQPWFSTNYIFYIFSQGTNINLEKKINYFNSKSSILPDFTFLGVPVDINKSNIILEPEAVQIDDNINNLSTNAIWKILLKNSHETTYNDIRKYKGNNTVERNRLNLEAFYTADTMEDIYQILQFIPIIKQDELFEISENKEFFEKTQES